MRLKDAPIQRKLMTIVLLTSGAVVLLTCTVFLAYDILTFRRATVAKLSTLGEVISANSTAALAFDNQDDATEVLGALTAERHIVAAGLYDSHGKLFAKFPATAPVGGLPVAPEPDGHRFEHAHLVSFQPVVQGANRRLGTLYIESDMDAIYDRLRLYGGIAVLAVVGSFALAYFMSRALQRRISRPILALAETARAVSDRQDYSVRAVKLGEDELGLLTDAFNQMLTQIHEQTQERQEAGIRLQAQLSRLDLLNRITRAIGERQDLPSIFEVIIRNLEDNLQVDFGCIGLYNSAAQALTVTSVGPGSRRLAVELAMEEQDRIPVDQNGLSRCVTGQLVYEPDVGEVPFPFPQQLARGGLRSLVAAPLLVEGKVFGVLIAARRQAHNFSSTDCEFLRQLSEHVALASHQAKLYGALQQAYDDLRQTQHTVMQQERLKALGAMASGIAHDINNAITPAALYTESLLEREAGLSDEARDNLTTIQRAIDDVAQTVSRMREFYRQREPELILAPIDLNRMVQQVVDLTRARWRDLPQERGVVIRLQSELAPGLPNVMGAEAEIRDALTNLVFNALDAMTDGGTLTLGTSLVVAPRGPNGDDPGAVVQVEVGDTGIGMDDETKRRSLEPFFTTKGERGTGLGLAMVYGMTQRHSADIQIDSAPGKGTTVRLLFPVPVTDMPAPVDTPAPALSVGQLHILVVDDDPLLLKTLQHVLTTDGHRVTAAAGGEAGIATFRGAAERGESFDAVITDLGMPYVDGRTVAAAVKQGSPTTPVILLTGWGQRLLAEHDIPPHVDRVLSKPPKLYDLRTALAELTSGRTPAAIHR
jgi:signal transduction histidine kinase/ActR/RegA family two-component response regulator/HAMP domain-containing protein